MPVLVGARSEPGCRDAKRAGPRMPGDQVVTAMPRAGRTHGGDVDTSRHEWYESACSGRGVGERRSTGRGGGGRGPSGLYITGGRGSARRARHMGQHAVQRGCWCCGATDEGRHVDLGGPRVEMARGRWRWCCPMWRRPNKPRRSQRDDDWQRVAELLAEEVVWQVAGDGTGQLWRARRGRAGCWPPCRCPRTAGRGYRPGP